MRFGVINLKLNELLAQSIEKSGYSKNRIATEIGINRGLLYKYLNGRLSVPQDIFHKILDAMSISYTQRLELVDLYYQETFGDDKFQRIIALEKIFKSIDSARIPDNRFSVCSRKMDFVQLEKCGNLFLNTENQLLEAVRFLFDIVPDGKVLTNYRYSQSQFDDTVYSCFLKKPHFDIKHILYFYNNKGSYLENLQNIFKSIRWLEYRINPICFYNCGDCGNNTLFPYFFAIGSYCLFLNETFSQGFIVNDANLFRYIDNYFNNAERLRGSRLAIFPQDIVQTKNTVSGNIENNIELCLMRRPCLAPIADSEFINAVTRYDLTNRDAFVKMAVDHYSNALGIEQEKFILSGNGLKSFAETGRIHEVSGCFIHGAPIKQRIRYFKKLMELNSAGRLKILNDKQFDLPDSCPMEVLEKTIRIFGEFKNVPEEMKCVSNFIIHINDGQLLEDIHDFCNYMYFTKDFYTEKGAESFLKSLIQFYN